MAELPTTGPGQLADTPFRSLESEVLNSLTHLTEMTAGLCGDARDSNLTAADFQVTQQLTKREFDRLNAVQLSPELRIWVQRYGEVGHRHPFLWSWCRRGVEITTLSAVDQNLYDRLCDTKVLGVMFDVLLDDVADRGGDEVLLRQLTEIPGTGEQSWHSFSIEDQRYAGLAQDVWAEIQCRVQQLPRYPEFSRLLKYDYAQLMNTMTYSHLLNYHPSMVNLTEHDLYLPHNMHMMVSATMDLMASLEFDCGELGRVREAIWHAQCMGRIGNQVTTWQRELVEGDFSSGVFARAVSLGDLSPADLNSGNRQHVERVVLEAGHEEHFLRRWQSHRRFLLSVAELLKTVDIQQLVRGLESLICLHIGSRGLK